MSCSCVVARVVLAMIAVVGICLPTPHASSKEIRPKLDTYSSSTSGLA